MNESGNIYRYVGDDIGTDLEKNTEYQVVTWGIDYVVLQKEYSDEKIEITKEEFRLHQDRGTLDLK